MEVVGWWGGGVVGWWGGGVVGWWGGGVVGWWGGGVVGWWGGGWRAAGPGLKSQPGFFFFSLIFVQIHTYGFI